MYDILAANSDHHDSTTSGPIDLSKASFLYSDAYFVLHYQPHIQIRYLLHLDTQFLIINFSAII